MEKVSFLIECSKDGADRTFENSKDLLNDAISSQCFSDQANCQAEHRQATVQLFVENLGLINGFGVVRHEKKVELSYCNVS